MGIELIRQWSRVGTWGAIADIRERARLANEAFRDADQQSRKCGADGIAREHFLGKKDAACSELDSCRGMYQICETEHRAILEYIEKEATDLLGVVPLIPEAGPTPEDAANRAQAMAGLLASLLARGPGKKKSARRDPRKKKGTHPRTAIKASAAKLFTKLRKSLGSGKAAANEVNHKLKTEYSTGTLSRYAREMKSRIK